MFFTPQIIIKFLLTILSTFLLVYPVKRLAIYFKVMDIPNSRKVHKKPIPRLGGLAIVLGTYISLFLFNPSHENLLVYFIGSLIIAITGVLDDILTLTPIVKLLGQFLATIVLIFDGVIIEKLNIPFIGIIELAPIVSIVITLVWIVGITNAINLIDGLDGLASGVSIIALISILVMAVMDERIFVVYLCISLIGSNIGFLIHNFYPAKIYMGDTGSLFLGYSIAVISILGLFKKITLFSFVIPIILLAVPIFDTLFAILRRALNREKIMQPDKKHIHHQFLAAGFSHRTTVLIIYLISAVFGMLAIIFSKASLNVLLLITSLWVVMVFLLAEIVGLVGNKSILYSLSRKLHRMRLEKEED